MSYGSIYRVAGNNSFGEPSGNGGPALQAVLDTANDAVLDAAGNLVIADGNQVRVIAVSTGTYYGQQMTAGHIYGVAGTAEAGYSGDGGPATQAEVTATNIALDGSGNIVIGRDGRIRVVAAATGTYYSQPMTIGNIYTIAGHGRFYSTSGMPDARTQFYFPHGAATDTHGDLLTTDQQHCLIWFSAGRSGQIFGRAVTAGDFYQVGGTGTCGLSSDGGPATQAEFGINAVASFDHWGNVAVADAGNCRIQVIAAATGTYYGQHMTAGDIYTIAGDGSWMYSGDGGPATQAGIDPVQAVTDAAGNVVFADANSRVRVIAEKTGTFYGQQMTADDIYTIAGTGTQGFSGNGGPATAADLTSPDAVALDPHGNVAIADGFGVVWLAAVKTGTYYGQHMTAGDIYVVAGHGSSLGTDGLGDGGPATQARLDEPDGVAVTPDGTLIIADYYDNRIRTVTG